MHRRFAETLTTLILGGDYQRTSIIHRIHRALQPNVPTDWIRPVVDEIVFHLPRRPQSKVLLRALCNGFGAVEEDPESFIDILIYSYDSIDEIFDLEKVRPEFVPQRYSFLEWNLPQLVTTGELQQWLGISLRQFEWLTSGGCDGTLRHPRYSYEWRIASGRKARLLEQPSPVLKRVQRTLLQEVLNLIPVHEAAHAFRTGRSILTNAQPHIRQNVVWKIDLANCFYSVWHPRIAGFMRMLGYPDQVASALARLCTNRVPQAVVRSGKRHLSRDRYEEMSQLLPNLHLPPGAPTSPALLNLICYNLDVRLTGLADKFGATYTRYADDFTFSGGQRFKHALPQFRTFAQAIMIDEGFSLRMSKSRTMISSRRQSVTGVIVNQKANTTRTEYKQLKAILHNCRVFGIESQNRSQHPHFVEHLRGRIAFVKHDQSSTWPQAAKAIRRDSCERFRLVDVGWLKISDAPG